tara:strand:+ start:114 stop:1583 length:1470 start_codon:yes stop_codon:yes gene_type:complete
MKNQRIKRIIPEFKYEYEAYVYIYRVWIEEKNKWKFYVGRKHKKYYAVSYVHSSNDQELINDLATRKIIEFEILKYGSNEEMALEETRIQKTADGGIGAAMSDNWYNKATAGGLYGKGASSTVDLNELWDILKPRLVEHLEDPCNDESYTMNRKERRILKKLIKKDKLKELITAEQFLQTRDERFVPDHVTLLKEKFDLDANPDSWPPIIILLNATIVDNKTIKFKEGGMVIISGNHRSRGNINSQSGIGLNALLVPHEMWKGLKGVDFKTLSNRCNPDPEEPALETSAETAATWIAEQVEEKGLFKKSDDGKKDIPDFRHNLILTELKSEWRLSTKKVNNAITIATKRLENAELQMNNDNLVDFSDDGLKIDNVLNTNYLKIVATYTDENQPEHYDWAYKISADIFKIGKVIEEIRRKKYAKKGIVLVYFKTKAQRNSEAWKKLKKTFEADLEGLGMNEAFEINIQELPLTVTEAKAQGFLSDDKEAA